MRNFFALIGLATIAFVGLGWYLDWYKLTRQPAPAGTQRLSVDLHPDKITGDVRQGVERGGEIIDRLRDNNNKSETPANSTPQQVDQGPASQFFSPSSSTTVQSPNGPWKSLDSAPPPLSGSPAQLEAPRR